MKWFQFICVVILLAQFNSATAWDAYDTPADFLTWMKANQDAEPQFIDGDVITFDKAELLRPFVPPAYQEELFYEGMAVDIKDAGDLTAADSFKAATAKFAGQAGLDSDFGIVNYTSGLPFDRTTFTAGSREDGFKLAWNFNYRWNYEGAEVGENEWVWVRPGDSHAEHEIMKGYKAQYYKGGGKFTRVLTGRYKRIWIKYRSDLADQD